MSDDENSGSVNFDAGLVPDAVQRGHASLDAAAEETHISIGGVRNLGSVSQSDVVLPPSPMLHTMGMGVSLTVNTGLTFIKTERELKNVKIERNGEAIEWNFWSPFARKDENFGEGLLRKLFGAIAKSAHARIGREVVFCGTAADATQLIEAEAAALELALNAMLPVKQDVVVCYVELPIAGVVVPRPVLFGELFSVKTWVVPSVDDSANLTTHLVTVNIAVNVGVMYASKEPHVLLQKFARFVESSMKANGLDAVCAYHTNLAMDSATLGTERTRDLLDILVGEAGYEVLSKQAVLDGRQQWLPPQKVDKVFGYGCDMLLISPMPEALAE